MSARHPIQYLVARATGALPERLQLWLAREPRLVVDGQTYDPHAQLLRSLALRVRRYGLIEPTVEEGRRRYSRDTRVFRGHVTEVGAVRDFEIPGAAGPIRVRHYTPDTRHARDLTIFLHGGGFVMGDLDTHDEPCRILCSRAGIQVLSVEYRLAPEHPFPAGLDDARAALAWAQANAASLGADPARISIGGDSAGGNLSAVTAQLATREGHPPCAQLLIYPGTDFAGARRSHELFGKGHILTLDDTAAFGRNYLEGCGTHPKDPRVSPLRAKDLTQLPPALVITAGFDLLRDEGEEYAAALREAGNVVEQQRVAGLAHGFMHLTGINRAAREATLAIAAQWGSLLRRGV